MKDLRSLIVAALVVASPLRTYAMKTKISAANMTTLLASDHLTIAKNNAPVFFFGEVAFEQPPYPKYPPCMPVWAYGGGNPLGPDTYSSDKRTPPVARCGGQDVGCNCRNPPPPVGQASGAFPTYYTVKTCSGNSPPDIRVNYNIFYQKDGTSPGKLGHDWDWERVSVIFKQTGSADSPWEATNMLFSAHSGYYKFPWNDVETLTLEQAKSTDPRIDGFNKNEDHPKVYAGWCKHANFRDKHAIWEGNLQSCLLSLEYRSDDWWWFHNGVNMIDSAAGTVPGDTMTKQEGGWGEASSIPPTVDDAICGQPLEGPGPQSVTTNQNLVDTSSPADDREAMEWAQQILDDDRGSGLGGATNPQSGTKPARMKRRRTKRAAAEAVEE